MKSWTLQVPRKTSTLTLELQRPTDVDIWTLNGSTEIIDKLIEDMDLGSSFETVDISSPSPSHAKVSLNCCQYCKAPQKTQGIFCPNKCAWFCHSACAKDGWCRCVLPTSMVLDSYIQEVLKL